MAASKAKKLNDGITKLLNIYSECDFGYISEAGSELSQTEYRVINFIGSNKKCVMGEISQRLFIPKNNVTAVINKLVDKNYAVRQKSNRDRRLVYVRLTENGMAIYKTGISNHIKLTKQLLKSLNKEEQKTFLNLLNKLVL